VQFQVFLSDEHPPRSVSPPAPQLLLTLPPEETDLLMESAQHTIRIEEARRLLDIATNFRGSGWPLKSKRFAQRALSIVERECGAYHRDIVPVLLCLAGAREDLADYARAGADYRRADDILQLTHDPHDLEAQRLRIRTIRGLASITSALGRHLQAEAMLKEALTLAEQTFGSKHGDVTTAGRSGGARGDVASALNDLAVHYRHTGSYEKASYFHHRALAIAEETLGSGDPQTATILHQLGILEHARGQFAAGERFARRSADIRLKTVGPDHPELAADLAVIAALLDGQGKHDEAELMRQRAAAIVDHWFGPDAGAHERRPAVAAPVAEAGKLRIA
jgi:tetratricopeptide (TPR) repeat protein